jgi:hypothetical protein
MLFALALAAGGWFGYRHFTSGPEPVWIDLGSLLRHPPGGETLYQAPREGRCYPGSGDFRLIRRFSSYNREVKTGNIGLRLSLFVRNDDGKITALVANEPRNGYPLAINLVRGGFASVSGASWDENGQVRSSGSAPLVALPASVSGGTLRLDARSITCKENLPEAVN